MSERVRDAGYDDWLDAVAEGEGYYLCCEEGHASLPPRRVCPHCGGDVRREPLPETGTVDSHTTVSVPTPAFADDTPYVLAVASFGPARLTGQLRGLSAESADAAEPAGLDVTVTVGASETAGDRLLVFEPR